MAETVLTVAAARPQLEKAADALAAQVGIPEASGEILALLVQVVAAVASGRVLAAIFPLIKLLRLLARSRAFGSELPEDLDVEALEFSPAQLVTALDLAIKALQLIDPQTVATLLKVLTSIRDLLPKGEIDALDPPHGPTVVS